MKTFAVCIALFVSSLSFASILPDLHVTVTPTNPVLIPYGTVTIHGQTLKAPLYVINSVGLKWDGKHPLIVDTISLTQEDVDNPQSCVFSGEALSPLYPTLQNAIGQTVLNPGTPQFLSTSFACEGLKVPAVVPPTLDIPVKVTVSGYEVQDGVPPAPVIAVEHIHVQ